MSVDQALGIDSLAICMPVVCEDSSLALGGRGSSDESRNSWAQTIFSCESVSKKVPRIRGDLFGERA